jgi:ribosome-associated toxin RatA of RatAB toxin-antitoxin module
MQPSCSSPRPTTPPQPITNAPPRPHHRRKPRWSPDQLYAVVSSVDDYSQFVPWCVGSTVLKKRPDGGYVEAELEVGFQVFVER